MSPILLYSQNTSQFGLLVSAVIMEGVGEGERGEEGV